MRKNDRERMIANAALVDEVNTDAIHSRAKLRESIDRLLLATPLKGTCPVFDQRAQLIVIGSEFPSVFDVSPPAGLPQAVLEIVQCGLRHVDNKSIDARHFRLRVETSDANCVPGASRSLIS